jgi:triacylglycerol lipase
MLSRLLRRVLLTLMLMCVGLAFLLATYQNRPLWVSLAMAVQLLLVSLLAISLTTGLLSRSSEPFAHWWRSLWGELRVNARMFVLRLPWNTSPPTFLPATGANTKVPVLLVHGYFCNHHIWNEMTAALRASGHPVLSVDLEPLFTSIDTYAPLLESAVTELCKHTGASKVALIGHSMGGLAIRSWMRAHGTHKVACVLTLGTPHAGTRIAATQPSPNGRQMRWQSEWLRELAHAETEEVRALMRIAISPQDNIVYPQRAQFVPGVQPTVFEGMGHLQLCVEPAVIHWVLQELSALNVQH